MTEAEPGTRERAVEVSPEVLGRICPEHARIGAPSRLGRLGAAARLRARLLLARLRFRVASWPGARCRVVQWRLRARLAWLRLRHRGRL